MLVIFLGLSSVSGGSVASRHAGPTLDAVASGISGLTTGPGYQGPGVSSPPISLGAGVALSSRRTTPSHPLGSGCLPMVDVSQPDGRMPGGSVTSPHGSFSDTGSDGDRVRGHWPLPLPMEWSAGYAQQPSSSQRPALDLFGTCRATTRVALPVASRPLVLRSAAHSFRRGTTQGYAQPPIPHALSARFDGLV